MWRRPYLTELKVPPESIKIDPAYIRPRDAYGALQLLRKLRHPDCTPHVVADKVAIMGFSHGGSSTTGEWQPVGSIPA